MSVRIQVKRGLDSQRQLVILADGEPAFTVDTKKFYIGDGMTVGGIEVTGSGSGGGSGQIVQSASDTVEGIVLLSTPPATAGIAIAVGNNDSRLSDARTPLAHSHAGIYELANTNIQQHIANTTTNPHAVTAAQIGAQIALGFTPENQANKNQASGYAGLGSDGRIPSSLLPDIAISDTFVVASQAAQTALTAQVGDIAVRTDLSKTFILKTAPASTFSSWQELLAPTGSGGGVTVLSGLSDVTLTTPTDSQVLMYQSSSSKWIAGTIASLPTASEKAAFAGTTGTPGAANKFVTDTDLRLTNARTPSAHAHIITDISSFVITSPVGNQALTYNATTSKWVNTTIAGTGSSTLATLTDALIASPSNGQHLVYNGTKWTNQNASGGSSSVSRYVIGASAGNNSYVVADKAGVTMSYSSGTVTFTNPNNALILSASIYLSGIDLTGFTTIDINFTNLMTGLNTSFAEMFVPQYQSWVDDSTSASTMKYQASISANVKKGAGIMSLIGVGGGYGYWFNLSF